jgi:PAS domain S-box-containing protein
LFPPGPFLAPSSGAGEFYAAIPKSQEKARPCIEPARPYIPHRSAEGDVIDGCVPPARGRHEPGLVRPALRWVLLLATAILVAPPASARPLASLDLVLLGVFLTSSLILALLPRHLRRGPRLDYAIVIVDTCLVSTALFHAGVDNGRFVTVFFLVLFLAALGADLPRLVAGCTLVAGLYMYLVAETSIAGGLVMLLTRLPFLYVVALYYGHVALEVRARDERQRRTEREKEELQAFLEITAATNSTLDLHQVLYVVSQRVAHMVKAQRCSILQVDEAACRCRVLASSDDPGINDLTIDLRKYPEVRLAIETRRPVVINDIASERILDGVRDSIARLGFEAMLVLPLMHGESLLGMLFLRAARDGRPFASEEIASCQVVANASANALRNAMLHDEMRAEVRRRREASEKLQNILDHSPDLIGSVDAAGRISEFSRGGEILLGLERDETIGHRLDEFFPEPEAQARFGRLLRSGEPLRNFETRVRHRDGGLRDALVAASPLRDEAGSASPCGAVFIVQNITELKAARGHLVQAEKLTALGEVVSGVAHELNNPLSGVLGYAQLLMRGPMEGRQQRALERIFDSAMRCQKIVQNLLAFSRRYPSEKRYLGLNGLVEKTLDLKEFDLKVSRIRVERNFQEDLPRTMLDFNQTQQVLLNLINNAQQAMAAHRGGGTLTLMTRDIGGMIQLRVTDDGPGIPRDNLPRIFDPFFTTKPVGEGTGLGLSISYGIIRDHGGRIWAESEPGRGTTMVVELPVRREAPLQETLDTPVATALPATPRPLRVLAVDDEPVILDLLVDVLSGAHHSVDTAATGQEALRKIERDRYDLILLDLKIPDTDGRRVFETICERWPALRDRVVFASGDTVHAGTRAFVEWSGRPCIEKPFRLETLAEILAETSRRAGEDPGRTGTAG